VVGFCLGLPLLVLFVGYWCSCSCGCRLVGVWLWEGLPLFVLFVGCWCSCCCGCRFVLVGFWFGFPFLVLFVGCWRSHSCGCSCRLVGNNQAVAFVALVGAIGISVTPPRLKDAVTIVTLELPVLTTFHLLAFVLVTVVRTVLIPVTFPGLRNTGASCNALKLSSIGPSVALNI